MRRERGTRSRGGKALLVAAAAIAIIAALAVAPTLYRSGRSPLHRLAAIVGDHRGTHARLTGGFSYGPCEAAAPNDSLVNGLLCAETSPATSAQRSELTRLAADMRALGERTAETHHASGLWNIIWRNSGVAVQELQAAAQLAPASATVQSDLGAALLQRAQLQQDPLFVLEAYTAIDSSLVLEPRLAEARFNRALALERLHLDKPASDAWSAYLDAESGSPWAEEARAHQRVIATPRTDWKTAQERIQSATAAGNDSVLRGIARQFPVRFRLGVQRAATAWAVSYLRGTPASDSLFTHAFTLSRALGDATNDPLWADVLQSVIDARAHGDLTRLAAAARGVEAYSRAGEYLFALNLDSADAVLRQASRDLSTARNPAVYFVAYDQALVHVQRHTPEQYQEGLDALRRLSREAPSSYRVLHGLIARSEGLVEGSRGNIDAAIAAYAASAERGRETNDPSLELRSYANLTALFAKARGERAAWEELYTGFQSLSRYADTYNDTQRFFTMAVENSWRRYPRLAALFQSESVRLASETLGTQSDSMRLITALTREAELFGRIGQSDRAFGIVRDARARISRIQRPAVRDLYTPNLDLVEGGLWLGINSDSAVRMLSEVVERYGKSAYLLELDRAYLLLASAHTAVGDINAAQRDFQAALAETDRRRSRFQEPEARARFLDQARPIIDRFVTFLADRNDSGGSLDFFESMRARVLLETIDAKHDSADTARTTVAAVRRSLPRGTSIISYAVVGREVIAWLVNRDTVAMYRAPQAARAQYLVNRFSALIATRSASQEIRGVAAELYSILVAPFAPRLQSTSRVVFIPDKSLHSVPFSALFDASSHRFVAQSFEVGIAPSIALYAESAARDERLSHAAGAPLLAVGNPSFDSRVFPLPLLPGAEREASRVAAYYGASARVLLAASATRRAFLELGRTAGVIHFAGHAVVVPESPLQSYLVLARDSAAASSGALYAHELFGLQLPNTRLVILSGCETASGRLSETEGASSLARALFATGVPAVIASLWAVDDEKTAEFFSRYHAELLRGVDPTTALATTQRQWLGDEETAWRSVADWAAFELFGGTRRLGDRIG